MILYLECLRISASPKCDSAFEISAIVFAL